MKLGIEQAVFDYNPIEALIVHTLKHHSLQKAAEPQV
jgi:hypothetical protein